MLPDARWHTVAASEHAHERRALDWLRKALPDREPVCAWSNFEFTTTDGRIYEVDALVLTPAGLFLVEIKSWAGTLVSEPARWHYTSPGGRRRIVDNPLRLANHKARSLRSLLDARWDRSAGRCPFVRPVVWLSEPELDITFEDRGEFGLVFHASKSGLPRVDTGLVEGTIPGIDAAHPPLHHPQRRALERAMSELGLRGARRNPVVNGWKLGELLDEGPRHQDFVATKGDSQRRVRIFPWSSARSLDDRRRLEHAAQREYSTLERLRHPGILEVKDFDETERGPALIFEHPDGYERLDHLFAARGDTMSVASRLDLVAEVARAVQHAHRQGITHRALCPQAVLVDARYPDVPARARLMDWHLARRDDTSHSGTAHLADWQTDERALFLAPEATAGDIALPEALDVWGLGLLTWYAITGRPPADDLAGLYGRLERESCLSLRAELDGVREELEQLVRQATAVSPRRRHTSVSNFVDQLEQAIRCVHLPDPDRAPDPLDARPGDVLGDADGDRFIVDARLGRGATAVALKVGDERGEREQAVLKIAADPDRNDILAAEADALRRVDSKHVIRLYETLELGEQRRFALLLEFAGEKNLRDELRDKHQLSLDDLRRFGEDLCTLLADLERAGVLHRDIKPDNLALHAPDKVRKRLMAFDFSLASTPTSALNAGTLGYIDPFASERGRHDEYSDRWAAAVTLHEMAAGDRPAWPDGDPALHRDAVASIASSRFPPAVRDALTAFFERALSRDYRARFDNAAAMREAWDAVFATTTHTGVDEHASDLEARLATLTAGDDVSRLDLSDAAVDALEREQIRSIGAFVAAGRQRLRFLSAAGAVRSELETAYALAERVVPTETVDDEAEASADPGRYSLADVAEFLALDRKRSALDDKQRTLACAVLGLPTAGSSYGAVDVVRRWPDLPTLASDLGRDPVELRAEVDELARRWSGKKFVAPLREDIARLLHRHDGIMSATELARALIGLRGMLEDDAHTRDVVSRAVVRALALIEQRSADPVFVEVRRPREMVLCASADLVPSLSLLGETADDLVEPGRPVQSAVAYDVLRRVLPAGSSIAGRQRLVRIAAACSATAAVSARTELYPVGMAPVLALTQLARPLSFVERITQDDLAARVRERFPEAGALPEQPELDGVLRDARVELRRLPDERGRSVWAGDVRTVSLPTYFGASTSTVAHTMRSRDEGLRIVREAERHLQTLRSDGGFCALVAEPRHAATLEVPLAARFELNLRSAESIWLDAMRALAKGGGVPLDLLHRADAPGATVADSTPFRTRFLPAVRTAVADALRALDGPTLLVRNGLFARYDALDLLAELRDHAGTDGWPPLVWLLLPVDRQSDRPRIDGEEVPTINPSERYRLPSAWVEEVLRRGGVAA